jgi:hypothetical protein
MTARLASSYGVSRRLRLGAPEPPLQPTPLEITAGGLGAYEFLLQDNSSLSRQTIELMNALNLSRRPRFPAHFGRHPVVDSISMILILPGLIWLLRVKTTKVTLARGRLQICGRLDRSFLVDCEIKLGLALLVI